MNTPKLTFPQRRMLAELKRLGEEGLRGSCTNSTLCALEKKGLARWGMADSKYVPGYRVEMWWAVDLGETLGEEVKAENEKTPPAC